MLYSRFLHMRSQVYLIDTFLHTKQSILKNEVGLVLIAELIKGSFEKISWRLVIYGVDELVAIYLVDLFELLS